MEATERRKLQMVLVPVMREIRDICERNQLICHMDGGTFLGAVRHQGFIPWDDDVDFAMPRQEYERFLEACERELDRDRYFLQTWRSDPNYCYCFAKIRLQNTRIIEDFTKNTDTHQGIFVDIFPYDNLPDGKWQRKWFLLRNHAIKNMIWAKCGYGTDAHKKQLRYYIYRLLAAPFSVMGMKAHREKLIRKYNGKATRERFTADFPYQCQNAKYAGETAMYSFEGEQFAGPRDYDGYLTELYGDYMQLPPEEERYTHTEYEIQFGPYGETV